MASSASNLVNNKKLKDASSVLRAIAHPLRMKILSFIDGERKINVNKIYRALRMEQSIASQHLRILRDVNLVVAERNGKFIFYKVNYPRVEQVNKAVQTFLSA